MKLTGISIRNFKSLSTVDVQLHPKVTVIVGPNAVGKSNFVDALRFLRDSAKGSIEDAIARRDGMARIRPHDANDESVLKLRAHMAHSDQRRDQDIYFEVETTGAASDVAVSFSEHGDPGEPWSAIRTWKFSALDVQTLRNLSTQDTDEPLRDDGSNWASVIRTASRSTQGLRMLERVTEMMQVVLPEFQNVVVLKAGSYLVPNFYFEGKDHSVSCFDPVQLSDGTLRIFGILLSLYQTPAPSLIVIEEPELFVHPGVLTMLAEAFQEVSETTQIIVTTHSPQLIEHFAPEQIRIVTMAEGATYIAPIKKTQREAVQQGLMSLGEFMAAEGLQPEAP